MVQGSHLASRRKRRVELMARHYIKVLVEYWYESDNDEFESSNAAEEFGWNIDELNYGSVQSITVEELENNEEEN
jgi:hypothetical protein